jgi:hypothetical protein
VQLILGIPFFGYGFQNVPPDQNGRFQTHSGLTPEGTWEAGTFEYHDLQEGTRGHRYVNAGGFTRHWDEYAQVPYLYSPTSRVFLTYDDEHSIRLKLNYALTNGLRGVMYWSMDADTRGATLQTVMHRRAYPVTVRVAPDPPQFEISWYGFTGQIYRIALCTNLTVSAWDEPPDLVSTAGLPAGTVTGANDNVTLIATGFPPRPRGFYRIEAVRTGSDAHDPRLPLPTASNQR